MIWNIRKVEGATDAIQSQSPTMATMKTVKRSYEIIDALREKKRAGITELAEELGLSKSTVHEHLQTLVELEFVHRRNHEYEISLQYLDYGGYVRRNTEIYPDGWPEVQSLALETGEHANLMVEEFGKGRYIYIAEGENSAKLDTYTGMAVYLHATALGKAILSQLPADYADEIFDKRGLPKLTKNTITDREELVDELESVRRQGYAADREERTTGVRCIASPIRGVNGEVYGSVGVSGPTSRFRGNRFEEELPDLVQRAANVIELNIANA